MRCVPQDDPATVISFYITQNLGKLEPGNLIPPGIWTLADVLQHGRDNRICPYFLVRRMVSEEYDTLDEVTASSSPLDAIRGHHHLFFPLSPGPQGRRASLQRTVQGCYRRL